jgi:hypothetical protein
LGSCTCLVLSLWPVQRALLLHAHSRPLLTRARTHLLQALQRQQQLAPLCLAP